MSGKNGGAREYEQEIPFHLPSKDDWEEAVRNLQLSKTGQSRLLDILRDVNADVEMQNLYVRNHLTRDKSIRKLKELEKAAKKLRTVLIENEKLLPDFIPHQPLENIGKLFTVSAINEAIGRDIRPAAPSKKMLQLLKEKNIAPSRITKGDAEEADQQIRRDAGLAYADKLLVHALDTLIQPIEKWHEDRKRLSKGGRTKDQFRREFMAQLLENANDIIGEELSFDVKGNFFELCELVFNICGVSTDGIKHLISDIVRDFRLPTSIARAR